MKINKSKWEKKTVEIRGLKPHPSQEELYGGTTSTAEDADFAAELKKDGQRDPIHVMPDKNKAKLPKGTVLDGWRRAAAMKANGKTEIEAVIRHDLAGATSAEIDGIFVQFNLSRRQLSPLARARCAKHLLKSRSAYGVLLGSGQEELKKWVGKKLTRDARTVNRYLQVLTTPLAVQQAFDARKLTIDEACKIAMLPSPKQKEIATRIKAGEDPKAVVHDMVPSSEGRHKKASDGLNCLTKGLELALADIGDRPDEIHYRQVQVKMPVLTRGRDLLDELIARGNEDHTEDERKFEKKLDDLAKRHRL
jgi:ParB-like chromosome segregation protein Spo0J